MICEYACIMKEELCELLMWSDGEMNVKLWFLSSTQHNIFTESIGYAVAIETIQILRCVWET